MKPRGQPEHEDITIYEVMQRSTESLAALWERQAAQPMPESLQREALAIAADARALKERQRKFKEMPF